MDDTYFKQKLKNGQGKKQAQPTMAGAGGVPLAAGPGPNAQATQQGGGGAKDQSTGAAGSGFVNLSQMLDLNGQSGRKNANALAKNVAGQANAQQGALAGLSNEFNQASHAGDVDLKKLLKYDKDGNPIGEMGSIDDAAANQSALGDAQNKLNQGYKGPGSLSAMQGYNPLAKAMLGTGEQAGNLAKGGQGYAAEIARQTGLSPTQSAAGAFYGGVNNQMLKQTGMDYKDLGNQLDAANQESVKTADLARQRAAGDSQSISNYEKSANDYSKQKAAEKAAGPQSFSDMVAGDKTHTMDAGTSGRRNTTANGVKIASGPAGWIAGQGTIGQGGDAWDSGQQLMDSIGIEKGAQSKYWDDFLMSLPEGMRNYINGMVRGGNPGVDYYGDKLAPKNSDEDWNWFYQLFDAYTMDHDNPAGSQGNGQPGQGAGTGKTSTKNVHKN